MSSHRGARRRRLSGALALPVLLAACSKDPTADRAHAGLRETLAALSPLPPLPSDPTNRVADSPAAQALGRALFFDPLFSGPLQVASDLGRVGESGKVSCASCHSGPALDDRRSQPPTVSVGTAVHTRNSPPLLDSAYYRWTNWGGRFSAQWELPPAVVESPVIMNSNRLALAHRIFTSYRSQYEAVFGALEPAIGSDRARFPLSGKPKPPPSAANPNPPDGAWERMAATDRAIIDTVFVNYGKAIAAFIRTLRSGPSAFDRYMAGERSAMSSAAARGAALFAGKAGCASCHYGPRFTDDEFHNLGVPQSGAHVPAADEGRYGDVPQLLSSALSSSGAFSDSPHAGRLAGLSDPMPESARGAFRTPALRNVAFTAPYMHSG